jgi:hypothetical protein
MFENRFANMVLLALFALSLLNVSSLSTQASIQTMPVISVDPPTTQTGMNSTFPINLNITAAVDVCSWQAYLYYKNDVLEPISYMEGQFLKSHGATVFDGGFDESYNLTHGQIWMYCLRLWSGSGVDGNGILATIALRAKIGGSSPLTLDDTVLGNATAQQIIHTTTNGQVNVGSHDVSIISVTPGKTIVGEGFPMRINVTVGNPGEYPETFNVTAYANATAIATQTVALSNASSTVAMFNWNTSGYSKANYTISAYAWPVAGETQTQDNNLTSLVPVLVAMQGDIQSLIGKVDMRDIAFIARAFGAKPGYPLWDPNADLNDDDKIDMKDIAVAAKNFGRTDP